MRSVNKVPILGNVTRDPEIKQTATGTSITEFGIATNRVWKEKTGEKKKLTEFHNIVCFTGLADIAAKFVKKGDPIYIEGYLKTRSWEDKDSKKHHRTEIVVEELVMIGNRTREGAEEGTDFGDPDPTL